MNTTDGFKVTNVLQDGPCAGMEATRVIVWRNCGRGASGYEWWNMQSLSEARNFVRLAATKTRAELVAELESVTP